jgi:uncharacterized protein YjbJ (UPF0337 family)
MNWEQIEGQLKQLQGQVKSEWAKLTDDDLKTLGAKKDDLVGKIQERYGVLKNEAEEQVNQWLQKLNTHYSNSKDSASRDRPTLGH